jgi:Ferritin-like
MLDGPAGTTFHREALISLLYQAAELEHGLSCAYLFAAFSLKDKADDGLPETAIEAVRRWRRSITDVAVQEMGHLAIVSNLLTSLGAAPHFDRSNFPQSCSYYLPDYRLDLLPFSDMTIQRFIYLERPQGAAIPQPDAATAVQPAVSGNENEIGPKAEAFSTVTDLYAAIQAGLDALVARLGESAVFVGPKPPAAVVRFFEPNGWVPVSDLISAHKAIENIIVEGEGDRGGRTDSHYGKFSRIQRELREWRRTHPGFQPARPVVTNPFPRTPPDSLEAPAIVEDELATAMSDFFDQCYGTMLELLARFFLVGDESEGEAEVLMETALALMKGVIEPLGSALTVLPAGASHPGQTAGPSFMVLRTLHPLPFRPAAWALLRERLLELSAYGGELASRPGSPAKTLERVQSALDAAAGALIMHK